MQQHQYRARYYLNANGAYTLPHEKIAFYLNPGLFIPAIPVLTTLIMGFVYLFAPEEVTQQFVVFTGRLTRDLTIPNGYPVTLDNGTEYTRLYYCMMDSGIGNNICGSHSPVYDYTTCIQAVHNCEPDMNKTWPRDHGFLQCLQSNFNVSMRQTNVFLTCLDSSEGLMSEVFENMDSKAFLGSYNYISLLITSLAVMSSFVVATAGGIYRGNMITVNSSKHIKGINPLSWGCILVALIWNIAGFAWSFGMHFIKDSAFKHYPLTGCTVALTMGAFTLASGFFISYFIHYLFPGPNQSSTDAPAPPPEQGAPVSSYRPQPWMRGQRIGVQNTDPLVEENATDYDWKIITPLMVRTFAWCWVFTDGLLFLGLVQPQASILNSYAIRIFFGIILARLLQLVSSYFANLAYINRSIENDRWSNTTDPREFGAHMVVIFAYLASIPVLIDSLFHFGWAYTYADQAVTGTAARTTFFLFIILIGALPELCRIALLAWVSLNKPEVGSVLFAHELIFLWDWAARAIVVVVAIVTASSNLRDAQYDLKEYFFMFG
jgi:hypothetical protein